MQTVRDTTGKVVAVQFTLSVRSSYLVSNVINSKTARTLRRQAQKHSDRFGVATMLMDGLTGACLYKTDPQSVVNENSPEPDTNTYCVVRKR